MTPVMLISVLPLELDARAYGGAAGPAAKPISTIAEGDSQKRMHPSPHGTRKTLYILVGA
jgi:hypothetical protein